MNQSHDPLKLLFTPLDEINAFQQLAERLRDNGIYEAYGLDDSQRNHALAYLSRKLGNMMVIITPNELTAQRMVEDLTLLLSGRVMLFPSREVSFLRTAASSREIAMRRIEALGEALTGNLEALVVPADALMHRMVPHDDFFRNIITIEVGQRLNPMDLIRRLTDAGYSREDVAEARGQCALRGGILDVFPVGDIGAIRVEFFDDEVDSLRDFDVMTQRSIAKRERVSIYPASELLLSTEQALVAAERLSAALEKTRTQRRAHRMDRQRELEKTYDLMPYEAFLELIDEEGRDRTKEELKPAQIKRTTLGRNFAYRLEALLAGHSFDGAIMMIQVLLPQTESLLDYLPNAMLVLDQPDRLRERCENRMLEFHELFKVALGQDEALPEQGDLLFSYDQLLPMFDNHPVLLTRPFMRSEPDFKPELLVTPDGLGAPGYQGNLNEMKRDMQNWIEDGWRVVLLSGGVARGQRLNKTLFELSVFTEFCEKAPETLIPSEPIIIPQGLIRGFLYPQIKYAVLTENDIFGASKAKSHTRAMQGEKIAAFTDLNVGDYVVHENHGIGRYLGTVRLSSEGTFRDFLHIQYLGSDKLYVPTDQLDRVQKYIGSEGEPPKMNRLSGGEWQRQKAKVKASIQEIAGELVKLYANRSTVKGYAFSPDTPWQREFEDCFEYEETQDQLLAISDIKRDMEKETIMDRLLCGDVGYGKTEVALRAIFKCVMDGKQAALLAPTTILVQQHLNTMKKRFDGFPIRMATLSRFSTPTEQKQTIEALKQGELDVVAGTHRLLGKDVGFKDLGLLVVDEEQRFGVKHKEAIKQLKQNVDVLTLSATPIPRTLHMSMVGIRDMSLLQTPPDERYPVQTYVLDYQDGLVRDAISRELARDGQVYVLYNRVQSIDVMYDRLKRLVPEARIAIGHGQMREQHLEDVMLDFYEGKYDVLLCTTIIEAGLDVPRANTLIVCDADRFGLSQLYQLRGRVGRSNRLAYAYLTVNPRKVLTGTADKRLSAIREFTEFGSGFRVAMRDLEIRGTGNLLGSEQSGHMATVGYDLYVKMIEDSVRELRGELGRGDIVTRVELKVDAYLPQEYVSNDLVRVEMYKKIASMQDRAAREDLIEELIDRFGDPGKPVMNLIEIAHLKALCQKVGIDSVTQKPGMLLMRFSPAMDVDVMKLIMALKPFEKHVRLAGGRDAGIQYTDGKKLPEELLKGAVKMMEHVAVTMTGDTDGNGEGV